MGQGQKEELGGLAGLSTKVPWNGQEGPSNSQGYDPKDCRRGPEMQPGIMGRARGSI